MADSAEADRQALIDAGLTYIELPDSELEQLKELGSPVVEQLVRDSLGDETVDAFFQALEE